MWATLSQKNLTELEMWVPGCTEMVETHQEGQLGLPAGLTDIPLTNSWRKVLAFRCLGRCMDYSRCLVPQGAGKCVQTRKGLQGAAWGGAGRGGAGESRRSSGLAMEGNTS